MLTECEGTGAFADLIANNGILLSKETIFLKICGMSASR
jgi:hypothetical protein